MSDTKSDGVRISASEFDRRFDSGDDVSAFVDWEGASNERYERAVKTRRVNVDFPEWMIVALDREARRLGLTRQSVIKFWLGERLDHESAVREQDQRRMTG